MEIYEVKGKEVEMGKIGDLAERLGRSSQAIRKWEKRGIIPPTKFRDETNKRLYPAELIDKIAEIAKEENIQAGVSFDETNFEERAHQAFAEIEGEILEEE